MLKHSTLIVIIFFFLGINCVFAKNIRLEIPIVKNGATLTDTLDNGQVVTVDVSSDDAEQENDEMDALYDDDLDAGWEGDPEDFNILTTGLRFQNVSIPNNANIDSAYIEVVSHEMKDAEDVAILTLVGEASDNAATFDFDNLITDRPETNTKINWTVAQEWGLWTTHRTIDISQIIKEIVSRPGWKAGNALAIMLKGENQGASEVENAREFESFENIADPEEGGDGKNHPERVPKLIVYYSSQYGNIDVSIVKNGATLTDTLDNGQVVTVDVSSDDAEQENDEMDALYDDDLDAGWEGDPEDFNVLTTGLRFQNIAIPQGATIDSAYIQVVSHEMKDAEDIAKITIVGEASDNAATFDFDNLITERPNTNAQINWTVAEEWGLWTTHRTIDISPVIQEIVNRAGWKAGNALALMLKGENQGASEVENAREFESFENIADPEEGGDGKNHPERVPRLKVWYQMPTSVESFETEINPVLVYPNPATQGSINIEYDFTPNSEINIYNSNGQLVSKFIVNSGNSFRGDVNHLSAGTYILEVKSNNKTLINKVVIQ
jgi:hypothetical protein